MAWERLPEDYTDAVWSGSKRYVEINNEDGTVSFQDVTAYSNKEKSFFGAKDANRMNQAMNIIMEMVENGTDLYTAFLEYFATQKQLFEAEGDAIVDSLKSDYRQEITEFETAQEQVFDEWFDSIKDQLGEDAAGNLQNQIDSLRQYSDKTFLPNSGGTMTGPINMNGQTLSGLNTPTVSDEAATKGYTDGQILSRAIYSGGKNLLKNTARSQTINGVTFTVNDDGSVTVNGTATSQAILVLNQNILPPGSYLVSSGVSDLSVVVEVRDTDGTRKWYYGSNTPYNHTVSGTEQTIRYYLEVQSGKTVSNIRVYPMIRPTSVEDDSYEPYYKGLAELTSSMELLWENASPTSEFAAQSVYLSLSKYDAVAIQFYYATTLSWCVECRCNVGKTGLANVSMKSNYYRQFNVETTRVRFESGLEYTTYGGDTTSANNILIPYKIYGIKGAT